MTFILEYWGTHTNSLDTDIAQHDLAQLNVEETLGLDTDIAQPDLAQLNVEETFGLDTDPF